MKMEGNREDLWRVVGQQATTDLPFMIKFNFDEDKCSYQLDVFDSRHFWKECVTQEEFGKKCKAFNPKVEANLKFIFNEVKSKCDDLAKKQELVLEMREDGKLCWINLKFKLQGEIPYNWRFDLQKEVDNKVISENVILPMFSMLAELSQREKELFSIIARKDLEIQDFKDQGATSSRKSLESEIFDPTSFIQRRLQSEGFLDSVENPMNVFYDDSCQVLFHKIVHRKQTAKNLNDDDRVDKHIIHRLSNY